MILPYAAQLPRRLPLQLLLLLLLSLLLLLLPRLPLALFLPFAAELHRLRHLQLLLRLGELLLEHLHLLEEDVLTRLEEDDGGGGGHKEEVSCQSKRVGIAWSARFAHAVASTSSFSAK